MTTTESESAPQALLFDLGGVLIDIDFERAIASWAPHSEHSGTQLRAAFRFDRAYRQHERGEIQIDQYFAHLRRTLRLRGSDAELAAGWNAIFGGEITRTRELVEAVAPLIPCYAFSNSNATHKAAWTAAFPRVVAAFREVFVSSDLGLRKPEHEAFETVARRIGLPPASILFFDDGAENVQGALDVGMRAVQVRSPDDVAAAVKAIVRRDIA